MDRETAIAFVSNLATSDLVDFFYDTLRTRRSVENFGERVGLVSALCLARCSTLMDVDGIEDTEPVVEVLATAANRDEIWEPMEILDQSGSCGQCGLQLRCAVKRALCPLCGSDVSCT
jgi:hypothetical protein